MYFQQVVFPHHTVKIHQACLHGINSYLTLFICSNPYDIILGWFLSSPAAACHTIQTEANPWPITSCTRIHLKSLLSQTYIPCNIPSSTTKISSCNLQGHTARRPATIERPSSPAVKLCSDIIVAYALLNLSKLRALFKLYLQIRQLCFVRRLNPFT